MIRGLILATVLCFAAGVLLTGTEEENGVYAQWCSNTTYCSTGYHCCSTTTCCPNSRYCCGGGRMCCSTAFSILDAEKMPAIESNLKVKTN